MLIRERLRLKEIVLRLVRRLHGEGMLCGALVGFSGQIR